LATAFDLIVIGEGVTGLACARHATSLGLKTATAEGNLFGGLVINIAELEGYDEPGSGVDVASALLEANAEAGVENLGGTVTEIDPQDGIFKVRSEAGDFTARAVVIASGARMKKLGVPGEEQFDHRGVSQCADCDGPMFQGEHVVVVGGGDAAFQEAITLSRYVGNVTILMRGDTPRAHAELVQRATALANVSLRSGIHIEEVLGGTTVDGITVRTNAGERSRIDCAGVFVFVGVAPNSEFAPAAVARSADGAIQTDETFQTAVRGIFAAGAVRAGYSGKLVDAVREARAAAEGAARLLAG
jgi:thioredoxin reductase (NADPH)